MASNFEYLYPLRSRLRLFMEDYGLLVIAGVFLLLAVVSGALFIVGDREFARHLVNRYGLYWLMIVFVLEGAMLLYFAPSESLVPIAIALLAETPSGFQWKTIALIMVVAVTGATIGQTALFLLAKRAGREWLLQKPWFRVSEDKLDYFDCWFQRWGRPAVPVSNALLFTRGMLTIPAGVSDMDIREFAILSAIGTFVFESWLAIGVFFAFEIGIVNNIINLFPI